MPNPDDTQADIERRLHELEQKLGTVIQQQAVFEAKIPLQLEMIISSIKTLSDDIRSERTNQASLNADLLSRVSKLESRPAQQAAKDYAQDKENREQLRRAVTAELVRAVVLIALSLGAAYFGIKLIGP